MPDSDIVERRELVRQIIAECPMLKGEPSSDCVVALAAIPKAHRDEITRLRAEAERKDEAIEQAAKWFDDYARQHRAKANACVTGDFDEQMAREAKVATNMDRADYLRQALQEKPNDN